MLVLEHPTELQEIYQRGLAASTMVNQPFWKETVDFMSQMIRESLESMDKLQHADDRIRLNALNKYLIIKDLVARIEQFPLAAIEAARELGDKNE
jgi:hypothetical protein